MAKQSIDLGSTPNDGTGTNLRAGGDIINDNFNEIYTILGNGTNLSFDLSGITNGQALVYNSSTTKLEAGTINTDTGNIRVGVTGDNELDTSSGNLTIDSAGGTVTVDDNLTVNGNIDVSSGTLKLDGNYPTGTNNVALGDTALDSVTTGNENTAIGSNAGTAITTSSGIVAVGYNAATATTGGNNTAIGSSALSSNVTGTNNTAIGKGAARQATSNNNVAVGHEALDSQTGGYNNTAVGQSAGSSITSGNNLTVLGYNSEPSSATAANEITLGDANVTSLRIPGLTSGASSGDVLTFDGTDLGFSTPSAGGTSWQAGKTADFNASAGEGYFVDTTSSTITATLPASPTIGDEISFIDVAGTFDTNNFTVGRNGKPIQGAASDLTVSIERAGFTLVFYNDTQGWVLKNK